MLTAALLSVVLAQTQPPVPTEKPTVPPYLPRSAGLGLLLRDGAISPIVRLGWEVDLVDQPRNRLIFVAEAGAAVSVAVPAPITFLHQESLIFSLGYRYNKGALHLGLQGGFGPVFYGGAFNTGRREPPAWLMVEGRAQLGVNLGPVALAGFFGISTLPDYDDRFQGSLYLGGLLAGVLVNWR